MEVHLLEIEEIFFFDSGKEPESYVRRGPLRLSHSTLQLPIIDNHIDNVVKNILIAMSAIFI